MIYKVTIYPDNPKDKRRQKDIIVFVDGEHPDEHAPWESIDSARDTALRALSERPELEGLRLLVVSVETVGYQIVFYG